MYRRGGALRFCRKGASELLVIALAATLFGACSDGDGGSSSNASTAAYAADYREATETFEGEVDRLRAEGRSVVGQGEDALLAFYQRLAEATAEARDRYRDLRPPDELASLHRRMVDLLEEQAKVLDALVAHAREGSAELDQDLQELARLLGDWAQAGREMSRRLGDGGSNTTETTETATTT
jgi:acyl-CoA reductase-like NAD-dependent aldehyde dehydrogenase